MMFRKVARFITTTPGWFVVGLLPFALVLARLVVEPEVATLAAVLVVAVLPLLVLAAALFLLHTYWSDPGRPRSWFLGCIAFTAVLKVVGTSLIAWLAWRRLDPATESMNTEDIVLVLATAILLVSMGPVVLAAAVLTRVMSKEPLRGERDGDEG